MWTILFATTTVICAIGWLARYVSTAAIIYFIEKKGYTQPSRAEIKACTCWVVKQLFKA